jgi:8-oxo-dGTP pyrophosphatase MutT (NUDIX family)
MSRDLIKPKAMAVFRRGNQILVNEVRESDGRLVGFRIPGGHIEFAEYAQDTIIREISEELGAALTDVQKIGVLENVFTYMGQTGHEIIFVYNSRFVDETLYTKVSLTAHEDNGTVFELVWHDPKNLPEGAALYPDGLLDLIAA